MACDCITEMDAKLREHNTQIQTQLTFARYDVSNAIYTPYIGTEKIDRKVRKAPFLVVPSYCPFCGKKYREDSK